MFLSKQPNFFRDDSILYATFPDNGPKREGKVVGHWLAWCPDLKPQERAMAFQVFTHAISNFRTHVSELAILDAHSIRFYSISESKSDLNMVLRSTWNGPIKFVWKWVDDVAELSSRAKWVPHPGA